MSTTSQYLVDNAMILSTRLKFKGTIAPSATQNLPDEVCSQFGNIQLSVIFNGTINPLTINLYATNEDGGSPNWVLVSTQTPTQQSNVYSINIAYRRVYISLVNGATTNNITLITLFGTTPLPMSEQTPAFKTIDATVTNSDLMALSRSVLMGRGRVPGSDISNVTISADKSLRVVQGQKMSPFDETDKLVRLKRFNENPVLLVSSGQAGTTGTSSGSSWTINGAGSAYYWLIDYGDSIADPSTILAMRGSCKFVPGTTETITRLMYGNIGVGTYGANFGVWYNVSGVVPVVVLDVSTYNDVATTVNITLGGVVYPVAISPSGSVDYAIGTAQEIANTFNSGPTPWFAVQRGSSVYFIGKTFIDAGTVAVSATGSTFSGSINAVQAGDEGTWTHVPASSFNLNNMVWWASGDNVEFELNMFNGGRSAKLAVVDKVSQELVDVWTATFATPLSPYPSTANISAYVIGATTSLTVYNASVNAMKGSIADQPTYTSTHSVSEVYAYQGTNPYPIMEVAKGTDETSALYHSVIKKIIVVADQPTRINLIGAARSTINGSFRWSNTASGSFVSVSTNGYDSTFDPSAYGYSQSDAQLLADNIAGIKEIDVNIPLVLADPIIFACDTGSFTEALLNITLIIDHYAR